MGFRWILRNGTTVNLNVFKSSKCKLCWSGLMMADHDAKNVIIREPLSQMVTFSPSWGIFSASNDAEIDLSTWHENLIRFQVWNAPWGESFTTNRGLESPSCQYSGFKDGWLMGIWNIYETYMKWYCQTIMTLWDFVSILMHHPWWSQLLENSAWKNIRGISLFSLPWTGKLHHDAMESFCRPATLHELPTLGSMVQIPKGCAWRMTIPLLICGTPKAPPRNQLLRHTTNFCWNIATFVEIKLYKRFRSNLKLFKNTNSLWWIDSCKPPRRGLRSSRWSVLPGSWNPVRNP